MTTIRTLATHDLVQLAHPRPPKEGDELGKAEGKAIDSALALYSHESSQNRRPTLTAMNRYAVQVLDEELRDAHVELGPAERPLVLSRVSEVVKAFRHSEVFGLPRPKTRMILINHQVGVYAQPDYWDGRSRFYEMKSYRAVPPPPDVALQLTMFQLAFPGFEGRLICFDRHVTPVQITVAPLTPLSEGQTRSVLLGAWREGLEHGEEKVLEFIDSPIIRYSISL